MILISNLHFSYPDKPPLFKDLSLEIDRGDKVALIGPNGVGKSTLLLLINGIYDPSAGSIRINGMLKHHKTQHILRKQMGMVFQNPDDQLFSLTVFDDVAFALQYLDDPKEVIHQKVLQTLDDIGLSGYEFKTPHHLSFGEKKLVSIATVLSYTPPILLFDEPTSNLDPFHRRKLIRLLQSLPQTMLIATHDLDMAYEVCPKTLVLDHGIIERIGDSKSILTDKSFLEAHQLELPLRFQL